MWRPAALCRAAFRVDAGESWPCLWRPADGSPMPPLTSRQTLLSGGVRPSLSQNPRLQSIQAAPVASCFSACLQCRHRCAPPAMKARAARLMRCSRADPHAILSAARQKDLPSLSAERIASPLAPTSARGFMSWAARGRASESARPCDPNFGGDSRPFAPPRDPDAPARARGGERLIGRLPQLTTAAQTSSESAPGRQQSALLAATVIRALRRPRDAYHPTRTSLLRCRRSQRACLNDRGSRFVFTRFGDHATYVPATRPGRRAAAVRENPRK